MISQNELPEYMGKALPELSDKLNEKESCANAYEIMRRFLDYTYATINQENFKNAKKCFSLAEKLYNKGNNVVKNAVENVYVYSFSHTLFKDEEKRKVLLAMIPVSLYALYIRQMMNSHI